ncbi:hypothetical protein AQUCO_00200192v1 [Aquilegia coerulea]|uniref:Uncharacterized protein n=1 Tax=Aquilegia coerulea TaxID=218851 RepID=A0A2G5F238_AQUCA|nr:hypothetical protein AQUCO_00200192v1 [Aquilegia coerulea]
MLMAPSTQFTKIWHMMNNGELGMLCGPMEHSLYGLQGTGQLTDANSLEMKVDFPLFYMIQFSCLPLVAVYPSSQQELLNYGFTIIIVTSCKLCKV